jgi:hypothetical protein
MQNRFLWQGWKMKKQHISVLDRVAFFRDARFRSAVQTPQVLVFSTKQIDATVMSWYN